MDHGGRHPDMPKRLENCFILTCNVSLEYEKTEVNSGFFYSNAEQREKLVAAERRYTDETCRKIIELKRKVCTKENGKNFVVINQKGIDPLSLDMLAKDGIIGLRRAKRRNMERLILACGGNAVCSVDDVTESDLGYAECVYEQTLGDDKYTFVEGVKDAFSCTILIKGQNEHSIAQIKDAIRDGTRAVKNTIDDGVVVPGAGAFEIFARDKLLEYAKNKVSGKAIVGVEAFAESMLIVPKCLADNSGQDSKEAIINVFKANMESENSESKKNTHYGIDISNGKAINPVLLGIYDNYCVKKAFLNIGPVLVQQLLLVDEVMRAGKQMRNSD
jgi:T-complex protein 1 subunit zeta